MKPATQAIACSASTSPLRNSDVADLRRGVGRRCRPGNDETASDRACDARRDDPDRGEQQRARSRASRPASGPRTGHGRSFHASSVSRVCAMPRTSTRSDASTAPHRRARARRARQRALALAGCASARGAPKRSCGTSSAASHGDPPASSSTCPRWRSRNTIGSSTTRKPARDRAVRELDLEGVAARADRRQVDRLEHLAAEALEAAGEVAHAQRRARIRAYHEPPRLTIRRTRPQSVTRAAGDVARAEHEVGVLARRASSRARSAGSCEKSASISRTNAAPPSSACAKPGEVRRARGPRARVRCSTSTAVVLGGQAVGDLAGAVGRVVVDDEDPVRAGRRALEHRAARRATIASMFSASSKVGRMSQACPDIGRAYPTDRTWPRTPPTSRSPPPSTSSPTSTSSTARSCTACSPTATRPRPSREATGLGRRADARRARSRALPGIGKTLEEKLVALLDTGTIPAAEKLRAKYPPGLLEMTRLPGLGPKRARKLFDELGIDSLDDAARGGRGPASCATSRASAPKFEASVLTSIDAGIGERPAQRVLLQPRARRSASRSSRRCARTRRPSASSSPARRAARRTPSRTSTSSRRPRDPGALVARARRARRSSSPRRRPNENAARGRTHTGLPVDLRVVEPDELRQPAAALHRLGGAQRRAARGGGAARAARLASTGSSTTRPARRCAARPRRRSTSGSACRSRPELREDRGELAPGLRGRRALIDARRPARRPAHAHGRLRRAQHDRGDGARGARARLRVHRDHRPLGDARLRRPRHARRAASARSSASREVNERLDGIRGARRDRDEHPARRLAGLRRRAARRSSTGSSASVHTSFGMPTRGDDEAHGRRDRAPVDRRDRPPDRPQDRRRASPTRSTSTRSSRRRRARGTMLEINSAPDRRDLNDVHARAAAQAGVHDR